MSFILASSIWFQHFLKGQGAPQARRRASFLAPHPSITRGPKHEEHQPEAARGDNRWVSEGRKDGRLSMLFFSLRFGGARALGPNLRLKRGKKTIDSLPAAPLFAHLFVVSLASPDIMWTIGRAKLGRSRPTAPNPHYIQRDEKEKDERRSLGAPGKISAPGFAPCDFPFGWCCGADHGLAGQRLTDPLASP